VGPLSPRPSSQSSKSGGSGARIGRTLTLKAANARRHA
jgi:hypothetical protein